MHTWWSGQGRVTARLREEELTAAELARTVADADDLHRVDGHAVFLTHDANVAPLALRAMVDTTRVLPEHVLLLSWEVDDTPSASAHDTAVTVRDLCGEDWDVVGLSVVLGYRERLDVAHILADALEQEPDRLSTLDPDRTIFVVSELSLGYSRKASWARWRQALFLAMNRLARNRADQLSLPRDRTVVIGRELEL
jgi:KUP system potassium uptake protein